MGEKNNTGKGSFDDAPSNRPVVIKRRAHLHVVFDGLVLLNDGADCTQDRCHRQLPYGQGEGRQALQQDLPESLWGPIPRWGEPGRGVALCANLGLISSGCRVERLLQNCTSNPRALVREWERVPHGLCCSVLFLVKPEEP